MAASSPLYDFLVRWKVPFRSDGIEISARYPELAAVAIDEIGRADAGNCVAVVFRSREASFQNRPFTQRHAEVYATRRLASIDLDVLVGERNRTFWTRSRYL